jgi:hypothetical protein
MIDSKDAMHQEHVENTSTEKNEKELRNTYVEDGGEVVLESDFLNSPEGKASKRRIVRKLDMTLLPMV